MYYCFLKSFYFLKANLNYSSHIEWLRYPIYKPTTSFKVPANIRASMKLFGYLKSTILHKIKTRHNALITGTGSFALDFISTLKEFNMTRARTRASLKSSFFFSYGLHCSFSMVADFWSFFYTDISPL